MDSLALAPALEFESESPFNPALVNSACDVLGVVGKYAAKYEDVAVSPPPPPDDAPEPN